MINRGEGSELGGSSCRPTESGEHYLKIHRRRANRAFARGCSNNLLAVLAFLSIFVSLGGCSTSATKSSPSVTPIIAVSLTLAPPASLPVGGTASVSATVSNDIANAGVDWVAACGSVPNCGSFSPPHTQSGTSSTFTAPLDVPAGNTITVTAISTTDHSKVSAAIVTITSTVTGVTITQTPPASFPSGGSVSVAASVTGDPSNSGIDWKASCGGIDCTSGFTSSHSAPGISTTFIIPIPSASYPSIVGSIVVVTAFATADHNFSATASFMVTAPISISITEQPPSTLLTNATATVIAVVTNDTTNSGVTWSVSCANTPCGSIVPTHTASGAAATFTAPPTVPAPNPAPNPVVTITATATAASSNVNTTANVTIVAPISVEITQGIPTGSIVKNAKAPFVATVTNDTANAGVDWTVSCGSPGVCGSFSPTHTASGGTTTFTAPAAVPLGNTVTITSTSSTDTSRSASETLTVTEGIPPNSLLLGQFVILMRAQDSGNGGYAFGGVITGDGKGTITKGNVDLADASGNASPASAVSIISPSTYSIGPDGRGQIQLTINTTNLNGTFGVNGSGAINLSIVFISPQHALLSESDSFGSGTGTLDLQNATDLASFQDKTEGLNGVYSLGLLGADTTGSNAIYSVAGALTFHTFAGSYTEAAYISDQSNKGEITSVPYHTVSHTFSNAAPDQNGELQLNSVNLGLTTQFNLDAWLIDANHFVITDWRDSFSGTPPVIVSGYLTAQPSTPSVSGTYAFTVSGATTAAKPQVAGGIFACGSAGVLDVAPLAGMLTTDLAITAACTAPANGRSLITLSGAGSTGINKFAAYPELGNILELIELDGGSAGTAGPSGVGVALEQTLPTPISATDFSGKYASTFAGSTALGLETFAAQIVSDGISAVSGTADVNSFNSTAAPPAGTPSTSAALTGSFTSASSGRFPVVFTFMPATGEPAPEITTIHSVCYIVDANACLLLGLDAAVPGTGILQLQQAGL